MVSSIDRRAPFVFSGSLTTCTTTSWPGLSRSEIFLPPSLPRPRRGVSTPGRTISSTGRNPFLSRPMSTKTASRPGRTLSTLPLEMLPTRERLPRRSRYSSPTRYPAVGFALRRPRPPRAGLAAGVPVASSSATRVSPRSTLTMTCFFTCVVVLLESQDAALQRCSRAPLRVDRLQQANGQESCQDRGSPVAEEGQWDPGDWHDPHVHADVDEDLEHQHRDDAAGDDRAEQVLRDGEDAQPAPDEQGVHRQHERGSDEAPALAHDREDEVGVVLGQEVELRLRRLLAAAGLLTGPDGDARLVLLVALVGGVLRRLQEGRQALLLVVVQDGHAHLRRDHESERERDGAEREERGEMAPTRARDEQRREADDDVDHARAEVRLHDHHRGRDEREEHHPDGGVAGAGPSRAVDDERRQRHDEQDLAELGGLEREERQLDRAPRAARHGAE